VSQIFKEAYKDPNVIIGMLEIRQIPIAFQESSFGTESSINFPCYQHLKTWN
jgi:hypothetical protein